MLKIFTMLTMLLVLCACSGLRTTDSTYTAHAESFNLLFLQFPPSDTQKRAMALVPRDAKVVSIESTEKDTSSLLGVLNRIVGVDSTVISGTVN